MSGFLLRVLLFYVNAKFLAADDSNESQIWPSEIRVGAIHSFLNDSPALYTLTLKKALSDLKYDGIVPKNVKFKFFLSDRACDEQSAMYYSWKFFHENRVDVFIGPECSPALATTALFASSLNIPAFAPFSMMDSLGDKRKYTTLTRVSQYLSQVIALATLIDYFNWTRVAVVRASGTICDNCLAGIQDALDYHGITLATTLVANFSDQANLDYTLAGLQASARIVIVCGGYLPSSALPLLLKAYDQNMTFPNYVYIIPVYVASTFDTWLPWLNPPLDNTSLTEKYIQAYRSVIVTDSNAIVTQAAVNTSTFIDEYVAQHKDNFSNYSPTSYLPLTTFYDSMYLYGISLNKTVTSTGANYTDGSTIFNATKGVVFKGLFGYVAMNSNADRTPRFVVRHVDRKGKLVTFMTIGRPSANSDMEAMNVTGAPKWGTLDGSPVRDTPVCGFLDELCKTTATSYLIYVLVGLATILFLACLIIGICFYRNRKLEMLLLETMWKVDMKNFTQFRKSARSIASGTTISSLDASSVGESDRNLRSKSMADSGVLIGVYFGKRVMAKKYSRTGRINFSREDLMFIKAIRDAKHENLNTFVGFAPNEALYFYSMWSFCSRGSLEDVLFNEVIKIDEMFQVSLIRDAISGLNYLHASTVGYHGTLYAKNCVVDGRWTLKLTNYGVDRVLQILESEKAVHIEKNIIENILICSAPEIVRGELVLNRKSVDVYQFGMILYQILFKKQPFEDAHYTQGEIVSLLKTLDYNGNPLRPSLSPIGSFDTKFLSLLEACWSEEPSKRVATTELKKEIFAQTKKHGQNIMDHVLKALEKYTNELEKIIEERTEKTNEERKRADNVLYQLLPRMVANALKGGHQIEPEVFDSATVYFSSVIGFNDVTLNKKPVVIVDTLNMIYRLMDDTISHYDAYKVETVLDSYLIVSGLPTRNGIQHASQMADLSLKMQQLSQEFCIPNMKGSRMTLRIGLNSGSVAAGVIGVTLPRYCLFGDTVNVASRMESTGEPEKVHISESLFTILEELGGYEMEKRGTVMVKGKGDCVTYWLLGKSSKARFNHLEIM